METPSSHSFALDGNTTVFPIPSPIKGDNYCRIEIDDVYLTDRTKYDIVNNSIVFVSAGDVPAGSILTVLVVQSEEAIGNLGTTTNMDIVAQNIDNVNIAATNLTSINSFANVYHSPAATAPTTRGDGTALQEGDLWFDTANKYMKVYTGSGWLQSSVQAASREVSTATDGQTAVFVSSGYSVDQLDVYVNGQKAINGSDFTAADGQYVTFLYGLQDGDKVEVISLANVTISDSNLVQRLTYTADGLTATFDTASTLVNKSSVMASINGINQGSAAFTVSGTSITFNETPLDGDVIDVMVFGVSPTSIIQQAESIVYTPAGETSTNVQDHLLDVDANKQDRVYTPSGTSAVSRTVESKLNEAVSVKDFGAVGDGVTDDTDAIQAAIDAVNVAGGGKLYIPAGKYLTSATITINGTASLIVEGAGKGDRRHDEGYDYGTIILTTATNAFDLSNASSGTGRTNNVTLRDFSISRLNEDYVGYGINIPTQTDFHGEFTFDNIAVYYFDTGIYTRWVAWISVINCVIQANTNGADIEGNIVHISDSSIYQNGDYSGSDQVNMAPAFLYTLPYGLRVSGNAITITSTDFENQGIGLIIDNDSVLSARSQVNVTGCYFEGSSKQAVAAFDSNIIFDACYSNNNDYDKFYFRACNVEINSCQKFYVVNSFSSIENTSCSGYQEVAAASSSASTITDYTAADNVTLLQRAGIPNDLFNNPIKLFGYARSPVSELGMGNSASTVVVVDTTNDNYFERNKLVLTRSATSGWGRFTISGGAFSKPFTITMVARMPDTTTLTWKLFDAVSGSMVLGGTGGMRKDGDDVFTFQIWGSGLSSSSMYLYLYPGGEGTGTGTEVLEILAYSIIVSDYNKLTRLPIGSVREFTANSAPSNGRHEQGEIVWTKYPSASGTIGWVCTGSGVPGTWKTFGAISA